jgi:hypothetical protein
MKGEMMGKVLKVWALTLLVSGFLSGQAMALVLFSDNFNTENGGVGALNYNPLTQWDVANGTVDLIGNGFFDFYPGNGLYLDLDGSASNAGDITTKQTFNFTPGEYWLSFDLGGSTRGDTNSVQVTLSLGTLFDETFILDSSDPLATVQRLIVVGSDTSGKLAFSHEGGDNLGLILDNVYLEQHKTNNVIPEPMTMTLLGAGLIGGAFVRKRK